MKFERITENQAYERIVLATKKLWENGTGFKYLFEENPLFAELDIDLKRSTTGGFGQCGQGEYSGLIVTDNIQGYRVISMFVDTLVPEDTYFNDITENLGKLALTHSQCDIRKTIPMCILYHCELFGEVPREYKKYC